MPFEVVATSAEERLRGGSPEELAEQNALAKALGAALPGRVCAGTFVLGTDTLVVVGDAVLGKPTDRREAADMLRQLSGCSHRVVSGVALRRLDEWGCELSRAVGHSITTVRVRELSDAERTAYLDSSEWEGKAGGYAIQGLAALLVDGIDGDYSNVVGLPLGLLRRLFADAGFDLLRAGWIERPPLSQPPKPPCTTGGADTHSAGIIPGSGAIRQEG